MNNLLVSPTINFSKNLCVLDLGLVDFEEAYNLQKKIFLKVKENVHDPAFILCQHHPVITIGRQGIREDVLVGYRELIKRKIPIYNVERGGKVTYHGPGQLLIYPIINLNYFNRDIHLFLRWLEELIIKILNRFSIIARNYKGSTGVWVEDKKIASIGIAIRNWITFHGLSINIKTHDLENFSLIRPCGMNLIMTSMEEVLNKNISIEDVKRVAFSLIKGDYNDEGNLAGIGGRN